MPTPGGTLEFNTVFFPLNLRVDAEVGGRKLNYAFETVAVIFHRPEVAAEVLKCAKAAAQSWTHARDDRSALNRQIFELVVAAMVADLQKNGARYAEKPEDADNPVPGLTSGKQAENQAIIDKLIRGAKAELEKNLIVKENIKPPK